MNEPILPEIMLTFLSLIVLNSLYIFGLYNAGRYELRPDIMQEPDKVDMSMLRESSIEALSWLRIRIENRVGLFWAKPLISCPRCMASVHSLIPYALVFFVFPWHFDWRYLVAYPYYMCALSALNKALEPVLASDH